MLQKIDFYILNSLYNFFKSEHLDIIVPKITALGNGGFIWIVISLLFICIKKFRKTGIGMAIGLILSLLIGNVLLKNIFCRVRPFELVDGINLLIIAPKDYSFPSGHTLSSVTAATVIFLNNKKIGLVFIALAILISFSRLYLYVHFPSDVLAGAIIGVLIARVSVFLTDKIKKY